MLDHCGFNNMSLGQVITMKHQLCIIIKPCPVLFMNIKIISSWNRKPISAVSCVPRNLVLSCSWNRTPISVISCETRRAYECGYLVMLNLIIMHNWCFIVMTCPRDILLNPQLSNIMGIVALTGKNVIIPLFSTTFLFHSLVLRPCSARGMFFHVYSYLISPRSKPFKNTQS